MNHQDFNAVVLRPSSLNNKKNRKKHSAVSKQSKIEQDNENLSHVHLGKHLGEKIRDARLAMGITTQRELSKKLNMKMDLYNSYESGKAIPDNNILQKIRRILNIKL